MKIMRGFIGMLCLIAAVAGSLAGLREDLMNFNIIHQFTTLVTYVNIDPAKDVGGAYMDAGEVRCRADSHVKWAACNAGLCMLWRARSALR